MTFHQTIKLHIMSRWILIYLRVICNLCRSFRMKSSDLSDFLRIFSFTLDNSEILVFSVDAQRSVIFCSTQFVIFFFKLRFSENRSITIFFLSLIELEWKSDVLRTHVAMNPSSIKKKIVAYIKWHDDIVASAFEPWYIDKLAISNRSDTSSLAGWHVSTFLI